MKNFLRSYNESMKPIDLSFTMGWFGMVLLWLVGEGLKVEEHGIASWMFPIYIGIGLIIYIGGDKIASRINTRRADLAYAKGFGDGVDTVFNSINRWGKL